MNINVVQILVESMKDNGLVREAMNLCLKKMDEKQQIEDKPKLKQIAQVFITNALAKKDMLAEAMHLACASLNVEAVESLS